MNDIDNILAGSSVVDIYRQKPEGEPREEWLLATAETLQHKLLDCRSKMRAMLRDSEMLQEIVGEDPIQD